MESDIWGEVILIVLSGLLYGMFESMEVAIRAPRRVVCCNGKRRTVTALAQRY